MKLKRSAPCLVHWSHHFMANRWENNGNSDRPFSWTVDSDYSHDIKRCLLLGTKGMTKLFSVLKSRDMTLPTKLYTVRAMVFPAVMYGCESWAIRKAERKELIFSFKVSCWRSPLDGEEIKPAN